MVTSPRPLLAATAAVVVLAASAQATPGVGDLTRAARRLADRQSLVERRMAADVAVAAAIRGQIAEAEERYASAAGALDDLRASLRARPLPASLFGLAAQVPAPEALLAADRTRLARLSTAESAIGERTFRLVAAARGGEARLERASVRLARARARAHRRALGRAAARRRAAAAAARAAALAPVGGYSPPRGTRASERGLPPGVVAGRSLPPGLSPPPG